MQGTKNPLLEEKGIQRVYVYPVVNRSFRLGVENVVYNALVRRIASQRAVRIVEKKDLADAYVIGKVTSASYRATHNTTADQLQPTGVGRSDIVVAKQYEAVLECDFELRRSERNLRPKQDQRLWSAGFSRTTSFPSSTQLGTYGTTSAIINESEFDRALSDLAEQMMGDVHEQMINLF